MSKPLQDPMEYAFVVDAGDVTGYWQKIVMPRLSGVSQVLSESETIRIQKALTRMRNGFLAARASCLSHGACADSDVAPDCEGQRLAQERFLAILGCKDVV